MNTDDLRDALASATADLTVHLPADAIRHRARRTQRRRRAAVGAAAVVSVAVLAVPTVLWAGGRPGPQTGVGVSTCPTPPALRMEWEGPVAPMLGPPVDTGATIDAPTRDTRYDVLIGLMGPRDQPMFVVSFRDQRTGLTHGWNYVALGRGRDGDFPGKRPSDPTFRFFSSQLVLGPRSVLDVGLYSRSAARVTVASEGLASDAAIACNPDTGWTYFWVQRAVAPLPPEHNTTPEEYTGPERVTVTAYDDAGEVRDSVTGGVFIGHNVQNPRDHSPEKDDLSGTPAAEIPEVSDPTGTPTD